MKIHRGRGSIIIENPEERTTRDLVYFRRNGEYGEYESLFTSSPTMENVIVTMPGFFERVKRTGRNPYVVDERIPMPNPDVGSALEGIDGCFHEAIKNLIVSGGGIVSVPGMLGPERAIASILRAYPKGSMVDRGTPMTVVASRDTEQSRELGRALRVLLPERDISIGRCDSDDIIVTSYRMLGEAPRRMVGLFVGNDVYGDNFISKVEHVSLFRNAARFGICSTPFGGDVAIEIASEGLFGPMSSSVSYADAVRSGCGVPVTVCWMKSPRPNVQLGYADADLLESLAMQENPAFVGLVANIVKEIGSDIGCVVHVDSFAMLKRLRARDQSIVSIDRKMSARDRKTVLNDIESGVIAKSVLYDEFPREIPQGVVIDANCRGYDSVGKIIPWRRKKSESDRTFIVDFTHDWDVHNGRPGILAMNDEARKRKYSEMGFRQISVDGVDSLPFV